MKSLCFGLLASLMLASCSSYQRDFKKTPKSAHAPSPTGAWKGTWKSEVNGHHGPLWCIITKEEASPDTYNFRYRAGWGALQFGDYTHRITTSKQNGKLPLNHSMKLPKNFGTYHIEGEVTPETFETRFQGNGDKGTMVLTRPH